MAISGAVWVAAGDQRSTQTTPAPVLALRTVTYCTENEETPCNAYVIPTIYHPFMIDL